MSSRLSAFCGGQLVDMLEESFSCESRSLVGAPPPAGDPYLMYVSTLRTTVRLMVI